MANLNLRFGFIGAGKMGTALAAGFVASGLVSAQNVMSSGPGDAALAEFIKKIPGSRISKENNDTAAFADVLFISVKPHIVGTVLDEIRSHLQASTLIVSIAAGVTLQSIENRLDASARVVRVMPNTGAFVCASASTFALGSKATQEDASLIQLLFSSVGVAFQVKECMIDASTGLSGSGPAFVATFIEAFSDGGVAAGIPREMATQLALQTVIGTAKLLQETKLHPGQVKDMVCSPGGTTIEGIHALERGGLRSAVIDAVRAASDKACKLGQANK